MTKYRLIIAGGRDFLDEDLAEFWFDYFLKQFSIKDLNEVEIVSGGARGADKVGAELGVKRGIKVTVFMADWDTLGKSAGYVRNKEMATYGTHLLAFWDGKSKGTKHMIDLARNQSLKTKVVTYELV